MVKCYGHSVTNTVQMIWRKKLYTKHKGYPALISSQLRSLSISTEVRPKTYSPIWKRHGSGANWTFSYDDD